MTFASRVQRLWAHLSGQQPSYVRTYPRHLAWRSMEAFLLLTDCLYLPELLMLLNRIFKTNTRRLTANEIALARNIFGDSINYMQVWIDERAHIGCRQHHLAYVGFCVINAWGPLSEPLYLHEMVHVWQYQRLGSVYIPRALYAQRTPAGYDYGGIGGLRRAAEQGRGLADFNFEQQGDVVADYFCLLQGYEPRWCPDEVGYLGDFERVVGLKPHP